MASAGWALQKAIHQTLAADAGLTGLIGGPRVFDDAPRDAAFPYVTFGQSTLQDFSTGTEESDEHLVTLHVWSRMAGRKQTHEIMGALRSALGSASLALEGHRVVNLRYEFGEARRDPDGETYHGIVRYRAVTEPV